MTELEKKMLISKDEYEYLMEHFGCESPLIQKPIVTQVNYYFDTDDFSMNRKNTTCRIRLKEGKYKATMKQHSLESDHSTETELEVRDGIRDNAFIDIGLKLQGELITERCIILKDFDCEVALDKNTYLAHEDYELEIEYAPEHEKNASSIMRIFQNVLLRRKYFLAYQESFMKQPSVPSKSNRFFTKKSAIEQAFKERENEIDDKTFVTSNENTPKTSTASYNGMDTFDYSDPDDYMSNYYGSIMPDGNKCLP